jgi:hypothetical protein
MVTVARAAGRGRLSHGGRPGRRRGRALAAPGPGPAAGAVRVTVAGPATGAAPGPPTRGPPGRPGGPPVRPAGAGRPPWHSEQLARGSGSLARAPCWRPGSLSAAFARSLTGARWHGGYRDTDRRTVGSGAAPASELRRLSHGRRSPPPSPPGRAAAVGAWQGPH